MFIDNKEILLDCSRGRYIPRDFISDFYIDKFNLNNSNKEYWQHAADPDHELYWNSWEWILNNAITEDGKILHHDGDLFLVDLNNMTEEEQTIFFES